MAIFLLLCVKTKKGPGNHLPRPADGNRCHPTILSPPFTKSGVIEFRGWGLVTTIWGPISLNPLGDSYGELDFRSKRDLCGKGIDIGGRICGRRCITAVLGSLDELIFMEFSGDS